jgi:hypothetical protein
MKSRFPCIVCHVFLILALCSPAAPAAKNKKNGKIKYQSVTGILKSVDLKKKVLVIDQKLKSGNRDVVFSVTKKTKVLWSRTKMKVTLKDLNPGVRLIIQFYKKKQQLVATKIVLPGGMKEAAEAILKGEIKGGDKKD